jgi:hypothetical protein
MPIKIEGQESISTGVLSNDAQRKKWLQEMKSKSLNVILEECNMFLIEMHLKDKRLGVKLKHVGQDEQEMTINKKVQEYNRWNTIVYGTLGAGCSGASAYYSNGIYGGLFKAAGEFVGGLNKNKLDQRDGKITNYDHLSQTKNSVLSEYSERIRKTDQDISQSQNTISQLAEKLQNTMLSILRD